MNKLDGKDDNINLNNTQTILVTVEPFLEMKTGLPINFIAFLYYHVLYQVLYT